MSGNKEVRQSMDPRFAGMQDDPKFRNVKRKGLKVKLDDRFSKKDLEVRRKAKVDKYGRRLKGENKDLKDFDRYFEREDEKEDEDKDNDDDSSSSSSEEKDVEPLDRARGDVGLSSAEYTSSESEASDESEEESEAEVLEGAEQEKPQTGEPSKTLAVVNLDWDHVRAADLLITFTSFLPAGGKIEKVCIYPSEFGKERMQREEVEGPPKELFRSKKKSGKEAGDSDSDMDVHDLYEEGDADKEVDSRALRRYQLERLRYYYAIVYCNGVNAAQAIYSNCDGTEYESTANIFDLRYVPDGMDFDDKPQDECSELPKNYKPMQFSTDALQHSNVKLTWDETPVDRMEVSKRAFTQKELDDMDFKAYLASDSDESEQGNNEESRNKLKSLVGLSLGDSKAAEEEEPDMEITFTPGLDDSKANIKEGEEETTIEKVKRKEQERRRARKQKLKELKHKAEQEKREKLQSVKTKKQDGEIDAKSRAELELLMMDDEGDTEKSLNKKAHFNMNEILKSEKEKKKKNKYQNKDRIVEDEFKPDLNDPRFNEVFENQDFAIDPSQPEYKGTKAMKEILQERTKRTHTKRRSSIDNHGRDKGGKNDISKIVNKLKRKRPDKKLKR